MVLVPDSELFSLSLLGPGWEIEEGRERERERARLDEGRGLGFAGSESEREGGFMAVGEDLDFSHNSISISFNSG